MEFIKIKKAPYFLFMLSALVIFILGAWWLYLVFELSGALKEVGVDKLGLNQNLVKMVYWEGLSFFLSLFVLIFTLFFIYLQDLKKTSAIQNFFASLTHELKTPLASMRLNSQVLKELIEDNLKDKKLLLEINKYAGRLTEDSKRLEGELDKSLMLRRALKRRKFPLVKIKLKSIFILLKKIYPEVKIKIDENDYAILADEFALLIIFRNLIENSIRHHKNFIEAHFEIKKSGKEILIHYDDNGEEFKGDIKKITKLFYKYNSPKGSGLGLYLIKNLTYKMKGKLSIENNNKLVFKFRFLEGK